MNLLSGYFHRCSYIVRPEEIVKKFAFMAVFLDIATLWGLTLFRMDIFGTTHGRGVEQKGNPLLKICHTYPTMMKLDTIIPYL